MKKRHSCLPAILLQMSGLVSKPAGACASTITHAARNNFHMQYVQIHEHAAYANDSFVCMSMRLFVWISYRYLWCIY